jgi:hypothetical protein
MLTEDIHFDIYNITNSSQNINETDFQQIT